MTTTQPTTGVCPLCGVVLHVYATDPCQGICPECHRWFHWDRHNRKWNVNSLGLPLALKDRRDLEFLCPHCGVGVASSADGFVCRDCGETLPGAK